MFLNMFAIWLGLTDPEENVGGLPWLSDPCAGWFGTS